MAEAGDAGDNGCDGGAAERMMVTQRGWRRRENDHAERMATQRGGWLRRENNGRRGTIKKESADKLLAGFYVGQFNHWSLSILICLHWRFSVRHVMSSPRTLTTMVHCAHHPFPASPPGARTGQKARELALCEDRTHDPRLLLHHGDGGWEGDSTTRFDCSIQAW